MKIPTLAVLCVALFVSSLATAVAPSTVGDFALLDHRGMHHQLSWYGDEKAVVLIVQGNGDPVVRNALPIVAALREQFENQGAVFFMLNAQSQDTRTSIAREAEEVGYALPILVDESQLVAESMGVQNNGEVLIIDPAAMTLLYRGTVQDRGALTSAITAALNGQAPASSDIAATGLPVAYPSSTLHEQQQISYSKDIVPILQDNCVGCHHEGGIGPWSMSSHNMILGWSKMMREVVMTRRMPPGQIDPHVGRPIQQMTALTTEEKQTLIHWIDAGAPMDGDEDPLVAMTFEDPLYTLGEPDIILKVPPQTIPATGVIDYRYIPVELNLDRDVWVRAMETVPGDRQVLHHVIAYLSSPTDKDVRGRKTGSARGESIGGFAPGRQPDVFRDNSGRLVPKGSNLLLQMHYTTSGKQTVDATEVGLFLYDEPPTYVMAGGVAGQRRFLIPAHAKEHKLEGEQLIERDAYLYSMMPHMHFRGKYISYTAIYPDGSSELLLSVPRYEFNWQFSYELEQPLFLPAGTRLVVKGAMDNSDRNRYNPDPSKPVHFGLQTKHEMFFGFLTLRYVGDTPESLLADQPADEDEVAGL